jgi:hypothetical protein
MPYRVFLPAGQHGGHPVPDRHVQHDNGRELERRMLELHSWFLLRRLDEHAALPRGCVLSAGEHELDAVP